MTEVTVVRLSLRSVLVSLARTLALTIIAILLLAVLLATTGWGRGGRCTDTPGCGTGLFEQRHVLSPGGWTPPAGTRPGWDWVPNGQAWPRADLVPFSVKVWYELPLVDRYAAEWMWHNGGFEVDAP